MKHCLERHSLCSTHTHTRTCCRSTPAPALPRSSLSWLTLACSDLACSSGRQHELHRRLTGGTQGAHPAACWHAMSCQSSCARAASVVDRLPKPTCKAPLVAASARCACCTLTPAAAASSSTLGSLPRSCCCSCCFTRYSLAPSSRTRTGTLTAAVWYCMHADRTSSGMTRAACTSQRK